MSETLNYQESTQLAEPHARMWLLSAGASVLFVSSLLFPALSLLHSVVGDYAYENVVAIATEILAALLVIVGVSLLGPVRRHRQARGKLGHALCIGMAAILLLIVLAEEILFATDPRMMITAVKLFTSLHVVRLTITLTLLIAGMSWFWRLGRAIGRDLWGMISALALLILVLSIATQLTIDILQLAGIEVPTLTAWRPGSLPLYFKALAVQNYGTWLFWLAMVISGLVVRPREVALGSRNDATAQRR